ncbi:MAG TPA: hypothetical protein VFB62_13810, partial [Polyangiaceae bacterium]|nr:hypothetical protein [Polyangiaceae bacterium]
PQEVELVGDTSTYGAIEVSSGADGSEIHNVAMRGLGIGVVVWGSHDVSIDGVWIHDTEDAGVFSAPVMGPTSLTLARSLIERARYGGIYGWAIEMDVRSTVLRDMRPWTDGLYGNGIAIFEPQNAGEETIARIADTLVERTREVGIYVQGASAIIERSVVRDTAADGNGQFGRGVTFYDGADGRPSNGAIVESTLERNQDLGVVVGASQARIDAVTLHDTTLGSDTMAGLGILVHSGASRATAEITRSLLDANTSVGVFVDFGDAVMEGLWVRNMQPNPNGYGYGVIVQSDPVTGGASHADIRYSVVEGCHELGVAYVGSDGLIEASVVRDVVPGNRGYGVGLGVQYAVYRPEIPTWATATVKGTLIEGSTQVGVHVIADVRMERCLIRETRADASGLYGDGVSIESYGRESSLELIGTRIERNARAGLSVFGAAASLDTNAFVCNGFDLHAGAFKGSEERLEDLGGNGCGCSEPDAACKAVSAGLTPPEPLEPLQ